MVHACATCARAHIKCPLALRLSIPVPRLDQGAAKETPARLGCTSAVERPPSPLLDQQPFCHEAVCATLRPLLQSPECRWLLAMCVFWLPVLPLCFYRDALNLRQGFVHPPYHSWWWILTSVSGPTRTTCTTTFRNTGRV